MGKNGHHLQSTTPDAQGTTPGARDSRCCCLGCTRVKKLVSFKCVFILILGFAVLLSAIFWLPFFRFGDRQDLDLDYAGHDIVASFMLNKSASFLENYIVQLEGNIFDEMSFPSTKVKVIDLKPTGPNITKVVFAVDSNASTTDSISTTTQSLIKSNFMLLITNQSSLHFNEPLFGDPFSFDVLKFKGGITVIPVQKAFLMQHVQLLFNFTLNFSVDEITSNFDELASQLKQGLHLSPYENVYIRLTNQKGSTVAPPTIVRSQVLQIVGIPTKSRIKQLAQTIKGSHKNLGLNNTIFGRVKQVSLSSILQHSLGSEGSPSPSPSPSPTLPPTPPPPIHHHHHHHHHHHDPTISPSLSPSSSPMSAPVPAPAPEKHKPAKPPCHFRFPPRHKHRHLAPSTPPVYAPSPQPVISPVPAKSPAPNAAYYEHSRAPSQGGYQYHERHPDVMPIMAPSPSPSSARIISSSNTWTVLLLILLGMHL